MPGTNTLRDEFETKVRIEPTFRHTNAHTKQPIGAERWQWLQSTEHVTTWRDGFETREAAFVDAVHTLLAYAQRHGHEEQYGRLMLLAWTLPLPLKFLQEWETDFRPAPKRVSPKIPDACRAPAQALAWGMDPELVRTAKARRAVVELTSDEHKPGRTRYGSSWLYRLTRGGKAMDDRDFLSYSPFMMDVSRVLTAIRREGLAEAFGVWTEPTAAADASNDTVTC